jgi:hypothetical protein
VQPVTRNSQTGGLGAEADPKVGVMLACFAGNADPAGLGLGLNIPLGPFLATVGGKGVYTNPKQGDEGQQPDRWTRCRSRPQGWCNARLLRR